MWWLCLQSHVLCLYFDVLVYSFTPLTTNQKTHCLMMNSSRERTVTQNMNHSCTTDTKTSVIFNWINELNWTLTTFSRFNLAEGYFRPYLWIQNRVICVVLFSLHTHTHTHTQLSLLTYKYLSVMQANALRLSPFTHTDTNTQSTHMSEL